MKSYTRTTSLPIVMSGHSEMKPYVLAIRDLPAEQKPREKLLKDGPSNLSLPELLAIVLNVGTKKEDLMSMTSRILKEYGEKSITTERDAKRLSKELDIPIVRATQIIATIEIGRRLFAKTPANKRTIRTPRDVYEYTKNMRDLPKEHLRGIYVNSHYQVIYDEVISIGTVDASIIHPREVFKPALEYAAAGVILVHNHPSGITTPSSADIDITNQLTEAGNLLGIELIDHVIVSNKGFESIMNKHK